MRVAVIGGGPAGLYFALLLKKARPDDAITVVERNRPDDTFGWGVVFSDQTLENFRAADPRRPASDHSSFAHWDDIDVHVHGRDDHARAAMASPASRAGSSCRSCRSAPPSLGVSSASKTEVSDERDLRRSASATSISSSRPTA